MEMHINHENKLVDIWLTNADRSNKAIQAELKNIFLEFSNRKYMIAVFESGSNDMFASTLELLKYNKKRSAQCEVERQRRQKNDAS